jgi:hypothetical protein
MAIKSFKNYFQEASAADLTGVKVDDMENLLEPRAEGEKEFKNAHEIQKHDYPADVDAQFKGTITTGVSGGESQTVDQGSSSVNQPSGGGDSSRTADKKEGDTSPQAVKEEVDFIHEGKVYDTLKKIVSEKSRQKVKFANGKSMQVDMQSANALVKMIEKLKPANQKKATEALEKSPEDMLKLLDVAFGGK